MCTQRHGAATTGQICQRSSLRRARSQRAPTNTRTRFIQYCADCHALPETSPSSFLSGSEAEVQQKLTECAEQIFYRLSMWDTAKTLREKTPMPPMLPIALWENQIPTNEIRDDLKHLRDFAATLVKRDIANVLAGGYENTEPCGPF